MTLMVSLLAAIAGGYLAAGGSAKLRTVSASVDILDHLMGWWWPRSRSALRRGVGAVELAVASGAALPLATQRIAGVLQAVLLSMFVVLVLGARRAHVPCGCFGAERSRPGLERVAVAAAVAIAAWVVAAGRPPGYVPASGVLLGSIVGFALTSRASRPVEQPDRERRSAAPGVTRRAVIAQGATAVAAVTVGLLFGWKHAPTAGAVPEGTRRIKPRRPQADELTTARSSEQMKTMLSEHGVAESLVEWDRAVLYEDEQVDRTILSVIVPIVGSSMYAAHVAVGPGAPVETSALLDSEGSGRIRMGQQVIALDKGSILPGPETWTALQDWRTDLRECIGVGADIVTICCGVCMFTGSFAPYCCGGCAIGAIIGCLYVIIT